MPSHGQAVVTGAFRNIVRYGVHSLLKGGVAVRTLTRNPTGSTRSSGGCQRLHWTSVTEGSRRSMDRCSVLYNTYWVRLGRGRTTFEQAVENSTVLFEAAAKAGVGRIVHFSVANASSDSRLPYFRGKGQVEEILTGMGIPYAIIRPTLVFGEGDLLLNNMAWALRRFPVFSVFGDGDYRVQPIYAEDLAALRWRPVLKVKTPLPAPPGPRRSHSKSCCGCWPRRWASASGWCIHRRPWASP